MDDASCRAQATGSWLGCVGGGCSVDRAAIADFANYERAHPLCLAVDAPAGTNRVGCSPICPPPTDDERLSHDGAGDGWIGCRGYGSWACLELLGGYTHYFTNHPACLPNPICAGNYAACGAACPTPSPGDR
jgi:hypothetical protein